jgi:hypothetical protein
MKKVPYFAGCLLAMGSVVVALNWGAAAPANTPAETPLPSTAPDWVETVRLYSAFGPEMKTAIPIETQVTSKPDVKLPPQKSIKVEPRLMHTTPRSNDAQKSKKVPSPVASGHIL